MFGGKVNDIHVETGKTIPEYCLLDEPNLNARPRMEDSKQKPNKANFRFRLLSGWWFCERWRPWVLWGAWRSWGIRNRRVYRKESPKGKKKQFSEICRFLEDFIRQWEIMSLTSWRLHLRRWRRRLECLERLMWELLAALLTFAMKMVRSEKTSKKVDIFPFWEFLKILNLFSQFVRFKGRLFG